jgi:hypothetical protein
MLQLKLNFGGLISRDQSSGGSVSAAFTSGEGNVGEEGGGD